MKIRARWLLVMLAGAMALGSVVSVAAQDAPSDAPAEEAPADGAQDRAERRKDVVKFKMGKHALRSESVVADPEGDGFLTIRTDRGTLKAVNGSTLVIEEADGTTVEVPVTDDTTIRREREDAELSDLVVGDHVHTLRTKSGDEAFETKHVHAISAERYAEMEARREACKANPEECPRRGRHGLPRGGPAGAPAPADEASLQVSMV